MTPLVRTIVIAVVLAAAAGAVGGWAGIQYALRQPSHVHSLDEVLHHELSLTPAQEKRIEALEAQFAEARKTLDADMRAANQELAAALQTDHTYGPAAKQAIEKFHQAMGALQEQTIIHVLAMRAELTAEQAERFDRTVREALIADSP